MGAKRSDGNFWFLTFVYIYMIELITLILFGTFASWSITTMLYFVRSPKQINHLFVGVLYCLLILSAEYLSVFVIESIPMFLQLILTNILVSWIVVTLSASRFKWIEFEHKTARTWTVILFSFITVFSLFICY